MAFNFSPKVVTDGLVLYLDAANTKSYTSGSTTWNDLSRSQTNGTLINGPTFNPDNAGSIVFDGVNDYGILGDASNIISSNQTEITVSVWVRTNVINSYRKIITNVDSGTRTIRGIYLSIGPSAANSNTYFGVRTTNPARNATSLINLSTINFSHLVGVYNGSNILLYLNGVQIATQTQTGAIGNGGIMRISGYDDNGERWDGNMGQIQIYNRALTAQEVLQNYNATKGRYGL